MSLAPQHASSSVDALTEAMPSGSNLGVLEKSSAQSRTPRLSVVIAALNEAGNMSVLLGGLNEQFRLLGVDAEIIVVDGGSKDSTWQEAERAGAKVVLQRRSGYGGAVREGLALARGEYVLTLDADLSHPPELLSDLWRNREKADILIGSRFIPGGSSKAPWARQFLSGILNSIFNSLLVLPVRDSSSGYRLYRREVLTPAAYRDENFNILQEILVKALCDGWSIGEMPLEMQERVEGKSHVSWLRFIRTYLSTLYKLWVLRHSPDAADYEDHAYDSRHLIQRYWQRRRKELIEDFLPESETFLDLGCGSSKLSQNRPEAVALDISLPKLRFLEGRSERRVLADAQQLPFSSQSFKAIVCSELLPYLKQPELGLAEVKRVLQKGGVLILALPDSDTLSWRMFGGLYQYILPNVRRQPQQKKFSRFEISEMLAEQGFRIERYKYVLGAELVLKARLID